MAGTAVVRKAGEGTGIWMLGGLYQVKASGEETGGAMTIIEFTVPEGMGPPPHTHTQAEAVYVLEGTLTYTIGDQKFDAGPGTCVVIPPGTWETFEPRGTVRYLGIYSPGGMDKFFAEAGEPAARLEVPPPLTSPPDVERLAAIGAKHGLQLGKPAGV
jgi:quercetin dioxygenase-like cupin family protein